VPAMTKTHRGIAESAQCAPLDAIWGAAGLLAREWGDYGYRMGFAGQYGTPEKPYLFVCRHSDGSVFYLVTDRYGNAEQWEEN
jgi:hypothetical protein